MFWPFSTSFTSSLTILSGTSATLAHWMDDCHHSMFPLACSDNYHSSRPGLYSQSHCFLGRLVIQPPGSRFHSTMSWFHICLMYSGYHKFHFDCSSNALDFYCCTNLYSIFDLACQAFASAWLDFFGFWWLEYLICWANRPCHLLDPKHLNYQSFEERIVFQNFRRNCFGKHYLMLTVDSDRHSDFHWYIYFGACYSSGTPPTGIATKEACTACSSSHYLTYISVSTALHAYSLYLAPVQTDRVRHRYTEELAARHFDFSSWTGYFHSGPHFARLCQCCCCWAPEVLPSYSHFYSTYLASAFCPKMCRNECLHDWASFGSQNSCLGDFRVWLRCSRTWLRHLWCGRMTCYYGCVSAESDVCCAYHLYFQKRLFVIHLRPYQYDYFSAQFGVSFWRWSRFGILSRPSWWREDEIENLWTSAGDLACHWNYLHFCSAASQSAATDWSCPSHSSNDLALVLWSAETLLLQNAARPSFLFVYFSVVLISCVFSLFSLGFGSSWSLIFHFCYWPCRPILLYQLLFLMCFQQASWAHTFPASMPNSSPFDLILSIFGWRWDRLPAHCGWICCLCFVAASSSCQSLTAERPASSSGAGFEHQSLTFDNRVFDPGLLLFHYLYLLFPLAYQRVPIHFAVTTTILPPAPISQHWFSYSRISGCHLLLLLCFWTKSDSIGCLLATCYFIQIFLMCLCRGFQCCLADFWF